jgi:hypothetical protein
LHLVGYFYKRQTFLKSDNITQIYHSHTAVFDSSVCKDILSRMADKFDVWPDARSIDIEQSDITSYQSAPNPFNSRKKHEVAVYHIFTDLCDTSWQQMHAAFYDLSSYSVDKSVATLTPKKGKYVKFNKVN